MKLNTNELIGPALDWAVAKCGGHSLPPFPGRSGVRECWINVSPAGHDVFAPSTDWTQGGPIIEEEEIAIFKAPELQSSPSNIPAIWAACLSGEHTWIDTSADEEITGPTPLVAAMRCYVASRLGGEVDVPDELCATTKARP